MGWIFGLVVLAVLGLMAFVRLAPMEAARWHVAPGVATAPADQVMPMTGAAAVFISTAKGAPADVLARLDAVAMATPRTERLAGSVEEGRITWVTRSALWGFPDATTAELRPDGVQVFARLRFGREDMGVNAKRLEAWLAAL